MDPIPGARWALPDREWGLAIDGSTLLVLLERKASTLHWTGVTTMPLPELIAQVEDWLNGTVVPTLQRLLAAIFPPATPTVVSPQTVADAVRDRLGAGAVQYVSSHRKFGYVPKDPGNV